MKTALRQIDLEYEDEISSLKQAIGKQMAKLREEFEAKHQLLKQNYEDRLFELKEEMELRRKMEIHEIEERKNKHINDLMDNFERAFTDMRNYYNSITQDNLALIKSLNDEIEDLKVKHAQNEKAMEEIEQKNARLSEPLEATQKKVKELQLALTNYDKDKISLKHARARLSKQQEAKKSLIDELATLKATYAKTEEDRDKMYTNFEKTVMSVQQKRGAKNEVLERMLDGYRDMFEVKKAQFTSVLRASNLDPVVLQNVTKKLDDVLTSKNEQISELKYEVAKIQKAHDDLVRVYEKKLRELGVPEDELNLEEVIGSLGTAPADLICV